MSWFCWCWYHAYGIVNSLRRCRHPPHHRWNAEKIRMATASQTVTVGWAWNSRSSRWLFCKPWFSPLSVELDPTISQVTGVTWHYPRHRALLTLFHHSAILHRHLTAHKFDGFIKNLNLAGKLVWLPKSKSFFRGMFILNNHTILKSHHHNVPRVFKYSMQHSHKMCTEIAVLVWKPVVKISCEYLPDDILSILYKEP